jgi:hypothetical protein
MPTTLTSRPKGWRTSDLLPFASEYEEVDGRMRDTGEWKFAIPKMLADIPEQIETAAQTNPAKAPITDEQIAASLNLAGMGTVPFRGGVRGVTIASKPRELLELLHGTNAMPMFERLGLGPDQMAHLTESTNVTNAFSLANDVWDPLTALGGRVYPTLADPGPNPFKKEYGMTDLQAWKDPEASLERLNEHIAANPDKATPQLEAVKEDLANGLTVAESLKKRGYTSMEYEHYGFDINDPKGSVTAHAFLDPKQLIPKYSPEGVLAAKNHPVKPIDYSKYPSNWVREMEFPGAKESVEEFHDPDTFRRAVDNKRVQEWLKLFGKR